MVMYKILNNEKIKLTKAEEDARKQEIEQSKIERQQREEKQNQEKLDKASGKQKLKDLGLTDDEIKAVTGT